MSCFSVVLGEERQSKWDPEESDLAEAVLI